MTTDVFEPPCSLDELTERWRTVNGIVSGLQAFSVTSSVPYTQLEVCYLPPFEKTPSIHRATKLLGTIRDATTFRPLFVFQPSMACFVDPSSVNMCAALQFVTYGACQDADLFVDPTLLDSTISSWLRVKTLGSSDPRLLWSQLSVSASNAMFSMDLALKLLSNATSTTNTSVSLDRLLDDVSVRVSSNSQLLNAIFFPETISLPTLESNLTLTMTSLLNNATDSWLQLRTSLLSTIGPLSLSNESLASSLHDQMRQWFELLPTTTLQSIGVTFAHMTAEFSEPTSFVTLHDPHARFSLYLPGNLALLIDEISSLFYVATATLINQMRANLLPGDWLDCFEHKLFSIRSRFNMTTYVSGKLPLWNTVLNRGIQQGYSLFEEDPAGDCSNALYSQLLALYSNSTTSLLVYFDFDNVTVRASGTGEIVEVLENSPWNHTAILHGFKSLASHDLPVQFSNEWYPGASIVASVPRGVITFNMSSLFLFDTLSSPVKKRDNDDSDDGGLDFEIVRSNGVDLLHDNLAKRNAELIACQPGYYALYNSVTGVFDCTGCPVGSYCLGSDGLQRLCSNGPLDLVNYTQALQPNSSCPFVCSVNAECRTGNDCIVPGPGKYCLNGWLATCPSSSFPELWHFQSQCSAAIDWIVSMSPYDQNTFCNVANQATNGGDWCRFSLAPFGDEQVSLSIRFEDPFVNTSTIALLQSDRQYRLDLVWSATTKLALIQLTTFSFQGSPQTPFQSLPLPVSIGTWYRLRLTISISNYIMMFWDDSPVLYSFFDAQKQTSLIPFNSGHVTLGGLQVTFMGYSLSSLIFSSFGTTQIADWRRETPPQLFTLFCDLSASSLADSAGTCVSSSCPNGQHRQEVDVGLFICLCDGDSTSNCDASLSSSNDCTSGEYLSWMGKYIMIQVEDGTGFLTSLEVKNEKGRFVDIQDCTDTYPLGFTCISAFNNTLSPPSLYGWHVTPGQSAVFFLPSVTTISEISLKVRSDTVQSRVSVSIFLSSYFSDLINRNSESQLCQSWDLEAPPFGTPLDQETPFILNTYKARLLMLSNGAVSAAGTGSYAFHSQWKRASTCLSCPSQSSISLDPRLSVRDCVCNDVNIIPNGETGCESALSTCPVADFQSQPGSGLFAPPLNISFSDSSTSSNLSLNADVFIDAMIQNGNGVQIISVRATDFFPLQSSSSVTFSVSSPGCPPSIKKTARYDLKLACLKPLIVSGGSQTEKVVSVLGFPGASLEIAVDILPSSVKTTPQFEPYSMPIRVSQSSMIRARSSSSSADCSMSDIAYSFVIISAQPSPQTPSSDNSSPSNLSCGSACIGVIAAAGAIAIVVVALIIFLLMYRPPPSRS